MAGVILVLLFAAVGWAAVVDARTRRIPNRVVLPAIGLAVAASLAWRPAALIGGAGWWLLFSAMHHRARPGADRAEAAGESRPRFGGGDAKLAAVCGILAAWHGLAGVIVAVLITGVLATGWLLWLRSGPGSNSITAPAGLGPNSETAPMAPDSHAVPMAPGMAVGTILAFASGLINVSWVT